MIIRFWQPLQRAARGNPIAALAVAAVVVTVLAWIGRAHIAQLPPPTRRQVTCIGAVVLMVVMSGRRLDIGIGAVVSLALGAAAALAFSAASWSQLQVVITASAAALLPLQISLRTSDNDLSLQRALSRGGSFLTVAGQFIMIGLLLVDWRLSLALGFSIVAGLLLPQALTAWRSPSVQPSWKLIPPLKYGHAVFTILAAPVVIGGVVLLLSRPLPVAGDTQPLLFATCGCVLLWLALTGSFKTTMAANIGLASGLGWAALMSGPLPAVSVAAAAGLSQTLPLLARFDRESLGGWHPSIAAASLILLAIGLTDIDLQYVTLMLAVAGYLSVVVLHPAVTAGMAAGDAPDALKRIFSGLEPYWRFYALSKLRFDPVYRQLLGRKRAWNRVLDLGCGPGITAALCATRDDVTAYCGVDLDLDKLLVARQALARAGRRLDDSWHLAQATLPLGKTWSNEFDTALLLDVLHYWPINAQRQILAECRNALTDDGILYLREAADSDRSGVAKRERFTTYFSLNPAGDLHFLSEQQLADLLAESGFDIVSREPSGLENIFWECRKAKRQLP
jgi:SAM-dependent methyltransferase